MPRWPDNTPARLSEAAMTLFLARGFEQTTVAQIAELSGHSERTFFRNFTSKADVLFAPLPAPEQILQCAFGQTDGTVHLDDALEALGQLTPLIERLRYPLAVVHQLAKDDPVVLDRALREVNMLQRAVEAHFERFGSAAPALLAALVIAIAGAALRRWLTTTPDTGDFRSSLEALRTEFRTLTR